MNNCCNNWWNRLTEEQKEWVHYYHYDIEDKDIVKMLGKAEVHKMHESRFELEGYSR